LVDTIQRERHLGRLKLHIEGFLWRILRRKEVGLLALKIFLNILKS